MKKIYLLVLLGSALLGSAQIVNIPDTNFKTYLLPFYDVNHDNEIQLTEAQNATSIDISSNYNISNISGIESFTNLAFLFIRNNPVSAPVNLSQNTLLQSVRVQGTYPSINITGLSNLSYIELIGNYTSLDISNRTSLTELYLGAPNLVSLNLTNLPQLQKLWINDANLTSIDVTQMPLLQELVLQQLDLTSINVTQNPNLKFLSLNGSPLGTVNISQNVLLENLGLDDTNITSINLQNNPLIKVLNIGHNNLSAGIDISNLTLLEDLGVFQCSLSTLDLSNNPLIKYLQLGNNNLTDINVLHLSDLRNFMSYGNKFTNINLSNNPLLKYIAFNSNPFLTHINIKNGNNSNIVWLVPNDYGWLPLLQEVCVDDPTSAYAVLVNAALNPAVNVTAQCTALSTEEISISETDIIVYPNPVLDKLLAKTKEKLEFYQIMTSTGNLVEEGRFKNQEYKINMVKFPKGVYFVKIGNGKFVIVEKVIKK
jgi:hypothetical protein